MKQSGTQCQTGNGTVYPYVQGYIRTAFVKHKTACKYLKKSRASLKSCSPVETAAAMLKIPAKHLKN